jgi:hypothetical protein
VLPLQSPSAQSVWLSQSLSIPSVHEVSVAGGAPQSPGHAHESSDPLHDPSPQNGGGPQSISQLKLLSIPSQTRSPQHDGSPEAGVSVH